MDTAGGEARAAYRAAAEWEGSMPLPQQLIDVLCA